MPDDPSSLEAVDRPRDADRQNLWYQLPYQGPPTGSRWVSHQQTCRWWPVRLPSAQVQDTVLARGRLWLRRRGDFGAPDVLLGPEGLEENRIWRHVGLLFGLNGLRKGFRKVTSVFYDEDAASRDSSRRPREPDPKPTVCPKQWEDWEHQHGDEWSCRHPLPESLLQLRVTTPKVSSGSTCIRATPTNPKRLNRASKRARAIKMGNEPGQTTKP